MILTRCQVVICCGEAMVSRDGDHDGRPKVGLGHKKSASRDAARKKVSAEASRSQDVKESESQEFVFFFKKSKSQEFVVFFKKSKSQEFVFFFKKSKSQEFIFFFKKSKSQEFVVFFK